MTRRRPEPIGPFLSSASPAPTAPVPAAPPTPSVEDRATAIVAVLRQGPRTYREVMTATGLGEYAINKAWRALRRSGRVVVVGARDEVSVGRRQRFIFGLAEDA